MHNIQINNSLAFQGSREIFAREAIGSASRLTKPIQEMVSQYELRTATEMLMSDLDCINLPILAEINENAIRKNLSTSIIDIYKKSAENLTQKHE